MFESLSNLSTQNWTYISLFVIVDLVLKAVAMWKAARNNQKVWFAVLIVVNSFGILPAIYLAIDWNHSRTTKPTPKTKKK